MELESRESQADRDARRNGGCAVEMTDYEINLAVAKACGKDISYEPCIWTGLEPGTILAFPSDEETRILHTKGHTNKLKYSTRWAPLDDLELAHECADIVFDCDWSLHRHKLPKEYVALALYLYKGVDPSPSRAICLAIVEAKR